MCSRLISILSAALYVVVVAMCMFTLSFFPSLLNLDAIFGERVNLVTNLQNFLLEPQFPYA